jgi:hypothetical protein
LEEKSFVVLHQPTRIVATKKGKHEIRPFPMPSFFLFPLSSSQSPAEHNFFFGVGNFKMALVFLQDPDELLFVVMGGK